MLELPFNVRSINRRLKQKYGLSPTDEPNYRVVFSDNEFEMRKGDFDIYHRDIFLRTEHTTRKVKKYSYIKSKFLIEKWVPAMLNPNTEEIKDYNNYEPMYVFEDKDGNYLRPIWRVADTVCFCNQNPVGYWERKLQYEKEQEKQEQADYNAVATEHDRTSIGLALATGEGITVPDVDVIINEEKQ